MDAHKPSVSKMPVKTIMKSLVLVDEHNSVTLAVRTMVKHKVGSIAVTKESRCVGIVTERDILDKVLLRNLNAIVTEISSIMSSPLITVDADTTLEKAAQVMVDKDIRRLLVTQAGEVVGIVTAKEIQIELLKTFAGQSNVAAKL